MLLGRPASLSARSAARANSPSPLSRADAPASFHPALATWRPYAGVVDAAARPTGLTWSGRHPAHLDAPLCPLPAPSPSPLASAAAATAAAPLLAKLRRSPPAALVARSLRQSHRRVRLRRGKPLRKLLAFFNTDSKWIYRKCFLENDLNGIKSISCDP